ncbi:hypothetical protein ACJ73_01388 [Blastomyces percursus]|uniref:Uncharacterized protein n=1 Tax=Blastomyces percursus TaxID=1658174 RepID=A0A1J9RF67_9EURO|nr:hypothetical protein ACJ73_01388 [Blastomyces percursus]
MPAEATASDSRGSYTQASAEKHAIVIAEIWKNDNDRYAVLTPYITHYDRLKAEGLLATISARRYREVSRALQAAPVDDWTTAFHQWLAAFRTEATKNGKESGTSAPTFDEFTREHNRNQPSPVQAAVLDTIDELSAAAPLFGQGDCGVLRTLSIRSFLLPLQYRSFPYIILPPITRDRSYPNPYVNKQELMSDTPADSDVQSSSVYALQYQTNLPEAALQALIHLLTSKNADSNVQSSAAHALKAKTNLPEDRLQILRQLLENADWDMRADVENILDKNPRSYSIIFSSYNIYIFAALYWGWVRKGIHQQFSCYAQNGKLFIEMPDSRIEVILQQKEEVLQAFHAGALAMEALTHFHTPCCGKPFTSPELAVCYVLSLVRRSVGEVVSESIFEANFACP